MDSVSTGTMELERFMGVENWRWNF